MNPELKKRLIVFGGIGIGLVVLILLIVWVVSMVTGGKMTYAEIEQRMKSAAMEYYENNQQLLPSHDGEVSVDVTTLSSADLMKPLEKLVSKNVSCSGKVVVKQNGDIYSYIPYLDCGEAYTTVELYKKVIDEKNIVSTDDGLYQMNGEYVFRGEDVNNYVKIGENVWRIVKVTASGNLQLIYTNSKLKSIWDDRYNVERNYNVGINDYAVSRIRTYLDDLYANKNEEVTVDLFDDATKEKMIGFDLCYGKRDENAVNNDGSIECAVKLSNQKVGLLSTYDYINASLDSTCKKATDAQCQNYNYLGTEGTSWWTITGIQENTYRVYSVSYTGDMQQSQASNTNYVRPAIQLSSDVMYQSGSGTAEDPYII